MSSGQHHLLNKPKKEKMKIVYFGGNFYGFSFPFSQFQPWELENSGVCPELDTCLCVALGKPLSFGRLLASLL